MLDTTTDTTYNRPKGSDRLKAIDILKEGEYTEFVGEPDADGRRHVRYQKNGGHRLTHATMGEILTDRVGVRFTASNVAGLFEDLGWYRREAKAPELPVLAVQSEPSARPSLLLDILDANQNEMMEEIDDIRSRISRLDCYARPANDKIMTKLEQIEGRFSQIEKMVLALAKEWNIAGHVRT